MVTHTILPEGWTGLRGVRDGLDIGVPVANEQEGKVVVNGKITYTTFIDYGSHKDTFVPVAPKILKLCSSHHRESRGRWKMR